MRGKLYSVYNKTRKSSLASEAMLARSVFRRMKGLIGRSHETFPPGTGLWIMPSNGIHTFGMSFPIDVAYLDSGNRVVKLYHCLGPSRIGALTFKTRSILELPEGMLSQTRTEVGDVLEFNLITESVHAGPGRVAAK